MGSITTTSRPLPPTAAAAVAAGSTPVASPSSSLSSSPSSPSATAAEVHFDGATGSHNGVGVARVGDDPARTTALRVRLGQGQPSSSSSSSSSSSADPLAITAAETAAYQKLNQKVLAKHPTLVPVLADPDAFMATMRGRFEAQKQIPGADPYAFDFSEWGVPALTGLSTAVGEKIAELDPLLVRLLPTREARVEQHIEVACLLDEMKTDIDGLLAKQRAGQPLPYRRVQELSFYVARTIGLLDLPKLNLRDHVLLEVDRYLQGYQHGDFASEARRYHDNDFSVFQKSSPVAGFESAAPVFEAAFFNPHTLEMLVLPTIDSLGADPFTRLAPYDMFIVGVTKDPAAADGFVRPGGDFYIHDLRHASAIFKNRTEYEATHHLDGAQVAKFEKCSDLWKTELDVARATIPDKQLRWAIGFLMFNFHHDRGYPMLPSSYQTDIAINQVPKLLYGMLKVSGQPVGFDRPQETLAKAHAWLQAFWLPRLPIEQGIVAAGATTTTTTTT